MPTNDYDELEHNIEHRRRVAATLNKCVATVPASGERARPDLPSSYRLKGSSGVQVTSGSGTLTR